MECTYEAFPDGGDEFKTLMRSYEYNLIEKGLLADNSGKSYRTLLARIVNHDNFENFSPLDFFVELEKIERPDQDKNRECQDELLLYALLSDGDKVNQINKIQSEMITAGDLDATYIAIRMLEILDENDFELDYYKMRSYLVLSALDLGAYEGSGLGVKRIKDKIDLENVLWVSVNSDNVIFVNEEEKIIDELSEIIRSYMIENKSKAIISLGSERGTAYKTYLEVENTIISEIEFLRTELALEKYDKSLDDLSEDELNEIKRIYPMNISIKQ